MQNTPYNNQYPNTNQQSPYSTPYNSGYAAPTSPIYQQNPNMSMTFNVVYSIYLIVSGALSVMSAFGLLFSSETMFFAIISLLFAAFPILTGVFLLQRKKAGNIMRLINNIYSFAYAGMFMIMGALLIVGGSTFTSFFEGVEGVEILTTLGVAVGVCAIIGAIIGIALTVLIMVYYHKRKHMFT